MPWHDEQKKDAANGETPRGAVSTQRSGDIRMGEPNTGNAVLSIHEHIVYEKKTQGIETSQYLEEKKITMIPRVVASEIGKAQTDQSRGSRTTTWYTNEQSNDIERSVEEGANPVDET